MGIGGECFSKRFNNKLALTLKHKPKLTQFMTLNTIGPIPVVLSKESKVCALQRFFYNSKSTSRWI